jgi:hypothetical protein
MADDSLTLSLEKSVSDPAHRPQFRKDLLAATIFVMGEIEGQDPSRPSQTKIDKGTRLNLRSQLSGDGRNIIPFFSSLENLRAFIQGPEHVNYLAISTRTLFEVAKGPILVLNPGSRVRCEFQPEDIEKLLQGVDPPASGGKPSARKT